MATAVIFCVVVLCDDQVSIVRCIIRGAISFLQS